MRPQSDSLPFVSSLFVTCCLNLSRCLYEWDWTIFYHGREKLQLMGLSKEEADEGTSSIDVDQAMCFMIEDKQMILQEIKDKHGSTKNFNEKLRAKWTDLWYGID